MKARASFLSSSLAERKSPIPASFRDFLMKTYRKDNCDNLLSPSERVTLSGKATEKFSASDEGFLGKFFV